MKPSSILGTFLCVMGAAACTEAGRILEPTSETVMGAASIEAIAGTGQTAAPGTAVGVAPAVVVRDAAGRLVSGVTVYFTVIRGGGTVERSESRTDASGVASAGRWTLGTSAGTNEVEATAGMLPAVRFSATSYQPAPSPPASAYDITVRYVGTMTARQQQAVSSAVARWKSVIVGDLSNIPVTAAAGTCFEGQPSLNETVDDLLLFVEFVDIDGAGAVLGQAGPCFIRSDSNLPVVGYLKLDTSDLARMEQAGTLDDVVLHEIGHVLGIGTLWPTASLVTGTGSPDPYFTGARAVSAYRGLGGGGIGVPVENTGGEGTRDSHWREAEFGNELMTGFISNAGNPLSAMTAASLIDLGYGAVTTSASTYRMGGMQAGVTETINLHGREKLKKPKFRIDRAGRKSALPN